MWPYGPSRTPSPAGDSWTGSATPMGWDRRASGAAGGVRPRWTAGRRSARSARSHRAGTGRHRAARCRSATAAGDVPGVGRRRTRPDPPAGGTDRYRALVRAEPPYRDRLGLGTHSHAVDRPTTGHSPLRRLPALPLMIVVPVPPAIGTVPGWARRAGPLPGPALGRDSHQPCVMIRGTSMLPCWAARSAISTCSSCGTTGSGRSSSGNQPSPDDFSGSMIRGLPRQ